MAEEEHYDEVDISDIIDESEHYLEADHQHAELAEHTDSENINTIQDSELLSSEEHTVDEKKPPVQNKTEVVRSTRLPIARIKNIMKMDPDVSVVSGDAVFLVTKATVSMRIVFLHSAAAKLPLDLVERKTSFSFSQSYLKQIFTMYVSKYCLDSKVVSTKFSACHYRGIIQELYTVVGSKDVRALL